MAEEGLKALVRRVSPWLEVHLASWTGSVGIPGQTWVEEDERGQWLVKILRSPADERGEPAGRLLRQATPEHLELHGTREEETKALVKEAQARAEALGLPLKFKGAELDLGRTFLRLFFTAPGRLDFRHLLRELSGELQLRVELRQLGPRDEARLLGGVGPCGRPLCCHSFLHHLRPIPLELAFEQQLFVSPERLTGACGRLRCCLAYERDLYLEALQGLPNPGAKVKIGGRTGKILAYNIFRRTAEVEWAGGGRSELPWDDLRP